MVPAGMATLALVPSNSLTPCTGLVVMTCSLGAVSSSADRHMGAVGGVLMAASGAVTPERALGRTLAAPAGAVISPMRLPASRARG